MSYHLPGPLGSTQLRSLFAAISQSLLRIPSYILQLSGGWPCGPNLTDDVLGVFDFKIGHAQDGSDLLCC